VVRGGSKKVVFDTLDPYVASVLAGEPAEVQRAAAAIIPILKSLAKNIR